MVQAAERKKLQCSALVMTRNTAIVCRKFFVRAQIKLSETLLRLRFLLLDL
jgi:hypothetical protein